MNYYKRHMGDYARDAGHLSALEHGIYGLLMDWYYVNEQPIPDTKAHRLARSSREDVLPILQEFFTLIDGAWRHSRIDREIAAYHAKSKKARASAGTRWCESDTNASETQCERIGNASETQCERIGNASETQCERIGNASETQCEGNASHKPLAISQDKLTNTERVTAPTEPKFDPLECPGVINREAWSEWVCYRRKKRKPISEQAAHEQWRALSGLSPPQQAACITASISNDYQGLFPEKYRGEQHASNQPGRSARADTSAAGRVRANVKRELDTLAAARAGGDGLAAHVQPVRTQVG